MGLKSLLCVLVVLSAACVGCTGESAQPIDAPATPPAAADTTG